jgi:rhodanese-related sulfurtransferase
MKEKIISLFILTQLIVAIQVCAQSTAGFTSQSVKEFSQTILSKNVVLIDVRTAEEFQTGHIKGAINIDMHDPQFVNKVLKTIKGKDAALYCRSGHRSKIAANALNGKIKTIYELVSGFNSWMAAGMPVSK